MPRVQMRSLERDVKINAMLKEGIDPEVIAVEFGITKARVLQIAMKYGVVIKNPKEVLTRSQQKSLERKRKIALFLEEGKNTQEIARELGISRQRVFQLIRYFGLESPIVRRKSLLKGKEPKYHWFDKILRNKKIPKEDRLWMLDNIHIPTFCPVFGIELNYLGSGGKWMHNSPSVDQIIPGAGYTRDNVQIISWRANRLKCDGTPAELRMLADFMEKVERNRLNALYVQDLKLDNPTT